MKVQTLMKQTALAVTAMALLAACGSDTETVTETKIVYQCPDDNLTDTNQTNDCTVYTPTVMSDSDSGIWAKTSATYFHEYNLTMPSDPGGGYLTLKLELSGITKADRRVPEIRVRSLPDDPNKGDLLDVYTYDPSDPSVAEAAFTVAPSKTYNVKVYNFFYKENVDYRFSWEFTGAMDCYEPNDGKDPKVGMQAARAIPTDTVLEAFVMPQFVDNNSALHDNSFDWYKFTLPKASDVTLEIVQSPDDVTMKFRLFKENGPTYAIFSSEAPQVGAPFVSEETSLDAGVYFIQVWDEDNEGRKYQISNGESLVESLSVPYKFRVNVQ